MADTREQVRVNWATVIVAVISVALVLGAYTLAAGKLVGATGSDIQAVRERMTALEERQTRIETIVLERLDKQTAAINDLSKQLAAHEGESRAMWGKR